LKGENQNLRDRNEIIEGKLARAERFLEELREDAINASVRPMKDNRVLF